MTREFIHRIGVVTANRILIMFGLLLSYVTMCTGQPFAPTGLTAKGYDSHIELSWNTNLEPDLSSYRLFKKDSNGIDSLIANISKSTRNYIDFTGREDRTFSYTLTATNNAGLESLKSEPASASTYEMDDEQLLTMVQEYTFRYFWDFAHPFSGLARERNTDNIVTTGGSGFGIMAIITGIERGFITRQQGLDRMVRIVDFLGKKAERFHGAFPHWMNGTTGKTIAFSTKDNGADLVETAFLIQGLLTARMYFDQSDTKESMLRSDIKSIWESVEWSWFRRGGQNVLYWHWSPNYGWDMNLPIRGFNECQIVYLLAAMSPTYPIPANVYQQGWAGGNYKNPNSYYGYPMIVGHFRGGPLFFSHYSYLGFDPRNIRDDYANYFVRNTNHSLINWSYCKENPKNYKGYSDVCWGLTASDNPFGYAAHEPTGAGDNGTITPTAALSSFPYTPVQSMSALKHFYRVLGERLWGINGFFDAFNLQHDWFAKSYLAIDQGPIICMIENFRTGLLWKYFMKNPEIPAMLDKLAFRPDLSSIAQNSNWVTDIKIYPNPANTPLLKITGLSKKENIEILISDLHGKVKIFNLQTGSNNQDTDLDISAFHSGLHIIKITSGKDVFIRKVIFNF
jgi:hypothetical protein